MAKRIKQTAEEKAQAEARAAERQAQLARLRAAIADGRAYLDTAFGRRTVRSYYADTGWAATGPTPDNGDYLDQQSFLVCLEAIKVA